MMNRKILILAIIIAITFETGSVFSQDQPKINNLNINTQVFQEFSPALSADGKTMVFQSNRDGGYKLYESNLQTDGKWSEPKSIEEINTTGKNYILMGGPSLTFDGNNLFFCALIAGGAGDMDIYYSYRNGNKWSAPQNVGVPINSDKYEGFPSISADGKKIYFTRTSEKDGACFKILTSEKTEAGTWKEPVELPSSINAGCSKSPRIMSDGRTLVFSSNRLTGKGNFDLYRSVMTKEGQWGEPIAVEFTNSIENEQYGFITEMDELIYFNAKGEIYSMGVPPEYILNKIDFTFIDAENKKPVKAKLTITDPDAGKEVLKTDSADAEGKYKIVLLPGKEYKFNFTAEGYNDQSISLGFKSNEDFKRIEKKVELKPRTKAVVLKISDSETNRGLGVDIKITNLETGEEIVIHEAVGRDGKYAVNLREGNRYNVEVSSQEGYAYSTIKIDVPKTTTQNKTTSGDTTMIAAQETPISHEIKVQPIKQGSKLVLKDIFFDFNSHNLQDSSYIELNRVIGLLKENPSINIEISAHTDDVGSDEFNLKLSQKRAHGIVDYLVSQGADRKRLKPIGFGKSKPIAKNDTEEGRAKNRRVELKVLQVK
jgi:outer membrane protein OmpA-like peptidoglycan-associated protein